MASVVDSVEASFKSLVAEKPYRSVTVKEICERSYISRHTFYMNFVDKRAIITYLFKRDAMSPAARAFELLSKEEAAEIAPIVFERFYEGVYGQRDYYTNLVKPMVGIDPTFELVVARCTCKTVGEIIRRYAPRASEQELSHIAYYHAGAQALFLEKWICDGYDIPPKELGRMQAQIVVPSLIWVAKEDRTI